MKPWKAEVAMLDLTNTKAITVVHILCTPASHNVLRFLTPLSAPILFSNECRRLACKSVPDLPCAPEANPPSHFANSAPHHFESSCNSIRLRRTSIPWPSAADTCNQLHEALILVDSAMSPRYRSGHGGWAASIRACSSVVMRELSGRPTAPRVPKRR